MGKGVGDIYIKAECNLLIQTYTIVDCVKSDKCDSDKLSNYTASGTITYDSNEQAYLIASQNVGYFYQSIGVVDYDYEMECDVKWVSAINGQYFYYGITNNSDSYNIQTQIIRQLSQSNLWYKNGGSPSIINGSASITTGKYYHCKITSINGTATFKFYDGDTELSSTSTSITNSADDLNIRVYAEKGNIYIKNITLKPL